MPLVADGACDLAVDGIYAASETCAGGTGTDFCYGDSGGPLVIPTPDGPKLAGVVSLGNRMRGADPETDSDSASWDDADWDDADWDDADWDGSLADLEHDEEFCDQ